MGRLNRCILVAAAFCLSARAFAGGNDDQNDNGTYGAVLCIAVAAKPGWENSVLLWLPDVSRDEKAIAACKFNGVRVRLWKKLGINGDSITRCVGTRRGMQVIGFKPEQITVWKDNDQDCK